MASGGAIEDVTAIRRPGPVAIPDGLAVRRSFLIEMANYVVAGLAVGLSASRRKP